MAHYFVDNDASMDGMHHVHANGCQHMPTDKRYLGNFYNVGEALIEARKEFWQSGGCERCAREIPLTAHAGSAARIGFGVPSWGRFR